MNALWNFFETLLGLSVEPKNLTFVQISLRGVIVFIAALAMVRLGHKRSLSHKTPFDAVLLVPSRIWHTILTRSVFWLRANLTLSPATDNAIFA